MNDDGELNEGRKNKLVAIILAGLALAFFALFLICLEVVAGRDAFLGCFGLGALVIALVCGGFFLNFLSPGIFKVAPEEGEKSKNE